MALPGEARSNASGYLMVLVGALLFIISLTVVLEGYASENVMILAMIAVQVLGIVIAFLGARIIFDPSRRSVPAPPAYNEFSVVCERCEKPVPSGAEKCPHCGNPIEWD